MTIEERVNAICDDLEDRNGVWLGPDVRQLVLKEIREAAEVVRECCEAAARDVVAELHHDSLTRQRRQDRLRAEVEHDGAMRVLSRIRAGRV